MAPDNGVARDFNELLTSNRTFRLRDETFEYLEVSPEAYFENVKALSDGDVEENPFQAQDRQILAFLKPEDHERYLELRKRTEDPVTIPQLNALLMWLWEVSTGTPIEAASPSPSGRGRTAASSKGA